MKFIQKDIPIILVVAIVCLIRIRRLRTREHGQDNQSSIARLQKLGTIAILAAALYQQKYLVLRHDDELLCDIPLEEENEASYKHPTRWQRIEELQNDNDANNKTNFTKGELYELVEQFGMEDIVRVPIPNCTFRYTFNREELLIYTLIKMKTGGTHTYMEEYVTHSVLVAGATATSILSGRWIIYFIYWC